MNNVYPGGRFSLFPCRYTKIKLVPKFHLNFTMPIYYTYFVTNLGQKIAQNVKIYGYLFYEVRLIEFCITNFENSYQKPVRSLWMQTLLT